MSRPAGECRLDGSRSKTKDPCEIAIESLLSFGSEPVGYKSNR